MNSDRFKFRIWDNVDKCYKYSFDLTDGAYELSHIFNGISLNEESSTYPIDNGNFEQCTGQRDKKGIPIYEGDIIYFRGKLYQIVWDNDYICFSIKEKTSMCPISDIAEALVVGNINENKNLLK